MSGTIITMNVDIYRAWTAAWCMFDINFTLLVYVDLFGVCVGYECLLCCLTANKITTIYQAVTATIPLKQDAAANLHAITDRVVLRCCVCDVSELARWLSDQSNSDQVSLSCCIPSCMGPLTNHNTA